MGWLLKGFIDIELELSFEEEERFGKLEERVENILGKGLEKYRWWC